MHIKVIKGKKYWYTSKRVGEKVTSVYIGPVKENEEAEVDLSGLQAEAETEEEPEEEDTNEEAFYFG